jgi:hypothetical protein
VSTSKPGTASTGIIPPTSNASAIPPVPDWVPTVEELKDLTEPKTGLEFTECDIGRIIRSLPERVDPKRVELLPLLLCDWARVELRWHPPRTPLPALRRRRERLKKVAEKAADLLQALDQLEGLDRWELVAQLGIAEGLTLLKAVRNEHNKQRLDEWRSLIVTISAAAAQPLYRPRKGQPRKIVAQLVLRDLAALFEYVTGLRATRRVDRTGEAAGKETGPFLNFAKAVWPVIFGDDLGLLSQLREWGADGSRKSLLISAIAIRRPEWGIISTL